MSNCPKCGSSETETIVAGDLSALICACRACGFRGVSEAVRDDEYSSFSKKIKKARKGI
ncbi:hypothetical protein H0O03_03935 [Candidatus Micrarchaeota archaeon]|nr:hypothetical protein [Candidatus Micrarchaeota archaeon]